jgi:hypothetical protein
MSLLTDQQLNDVSGGWGDDAAIGGSCLADGVAAGGLVAGAATFTMGPEMAWLGVPAGLGVYASCELDGSNGSWW